MLQEDFMFHKNNFFFQFGFFPCKAEQPLQGMDLDEKETHKRLKLTKKSV